MTGSFNADMVDSRKSPGLGRNLSLRRLAFRLARPPLCCVDGSWLFGTGHDRCLYSTYHEHFHM